MNVKHKLLGEMTDAEIGALVRAYRSGKSIEHMDMFGKWKYCSPGWFINTAYRIVPEPIRQAVIPWSVLADDIVAVAMDGDGKWCAYKDYPKSGEDCWVCEAAHFNMGHIKFDRGTEPYWWNTLQMRPGYEVKP